MNKELKAAMKIWKNLNSYEYTDEFKEAKNTLTTACKVLQIIKEKEVAISILNDTENADEYNNILCTDGTKYFLTKREYNLLKGWLK